LGPWGNVAQIEVLRDDFLVLSLLRQLRDLPLQDVADAAVDQRSINLPYPLLEEAAIIKC
jgi:hypothetical protein